MNSGIATVHVTLILLSVDFAYTCSRWERNQKPTSLLLQVSTRVEGDGLQVHDETTNSGPINVATTASLADARGFVHRLRRSTANRPL